ncbi:STAS domain-containing protein [Solirubrobacter ginsenosidimutans]|uniref:Anti-sigma factor antagonist n=1 Tax=Solirubrobacter ginsenosidimutans TaxID=490573 RepID=A0A9X3N3Q0_9ACTN|nr:STAS domain-containing protein [Solirubrobacter ginsenosidimutans]MDA0166415.1 STAS domain-containing protein [Solirubrobacter ginsenosidimutans]
MAPSDVHILSTEIVEAPVPIVRVRGELDISTVAQLARALNTAATGAVRRPPRLVVDLTALDFCDSSGLRGLIGAVKEVHVLGGRVVLAVEPEGALDRLLELSGLREFLRVSDSVEIAVARLS